MGEGYLVQTGLRLVSGSVTRLLGMVLLLSQSGLQAQDQQRMEEVLRIGDERPGYALTYVHAGQRIDDKVVVLDWGLPGVRAYDAQGNHVFSFGGRGQAPDRFQRPAGLIVTVDTTWVLDIGNLRATAISPEGQLLTTRAIRGIFDRDATVRFMPIALLQGDVAITTPLIIPGSEADSTEIRLQRFGGERIGDPIPVGTPTWWVVEGADERAVPLKQPWSREPIIVVSPSGKQWAIVERLPSDGGMGSIRIKWFVGASSAPATVWTYQAPVRALKDVEVDSVLALVEMTGGSRSAARRTLAVPSHPPATNAYGAIITDEGHVWVKWESPGESAEWHVLRQDRVVSAVVTGPNTLRLLHATPGRVHGVVVGEFDVPTLVTYNIVNE